MTSLSSLSNSAAHLSIPFYHSNLADGSHDDCQRRFAITSRLNATFFSVPCSSSTAGGKRLFVVALALHSFNLSSSIVINALQLFSVRMINNTKNAIFFSAWSTASQWSWSVIWIPFSRHQVCDLGYLKFFRYYDLTFLLLVCCVFEPSVLWSPASNGNS